MHGCIQRRIGLEVQFGHRAYAQLVSKLGAQPRSHPLKPRQKGRNIAAPQPCDKNSGMLEVWRKPDFGHGNGNIGQVRVAEGGARKQLSQNAPHFFAYPQLPLRWASR